MKIFNKLILLAGFAFALSGCKVDDTIIIDLPLGVNTLRMDLRTPPQEAGPDPADTGEPEPETDDSEVLGSYELTFGDTQLFNMLRYYRNDEVKLSVKNISLEILPGIEVSNDSEEFRDLVITARTGDEEIAVYQNRSITGSLSDDALDEFVQTVIARIEARDTVVLEYGGVFIGYQAPGPNILIGRLALSMELAAVITVKR